MTLKRIATSLLSGLVAGALLVGCSDSSSTDTAQPVAERVEDTTPDSIRASQARSACSEQVKAELTKAGYSLNSLYLDILVGQSEVPADSTHRGEFNGYYGTPSARIEGTADCTVAFDGDGSTVVAKITNGDITTDGNAAKPTPTTGRPPTPTRTNKDSGTGSGSTDRVAQQPDMGQAVGKGEYQVRPQIDSWHPEMVDYLQNPGIILPGGKIYNMATGNWCSVGHFATDSSSSRLFIITAAHCGELGSRWAYQDASGQVVEFGEIVEYAYTGDDSLGLQGGYDIAIIEVFNRHARWTSQPPITGRVVGAADLAYVQSNAMSLCRIGARDGLSCGNFVEALDGGFFNFGNQSRPGDSGGAIYAVAQNGDLYAVGIASYGPKDAEYVQRGWSGGMEVYSTLQHFGLSVI